MNTRPPTPILLPELGRVARGRGSSVAYDDLGTVLEVLGEMDSADGADQRTADALGVVLSVARQLVQCQSAYQPAPTPVVLNELQAEGMDRSEAFDVVLQALKEVRQRPCTPVLVQTIAAGSALDTVVAALEGMKVVSAAVVAEPRPRTPMLLQMLGAVAEERRADVCGMLHPACSAAASAVLSMAAAAALTPAPAAAVTAALAVLTRETCGTPVEPALRRLRERRVRAFTEALEAGDLAGVRACLDRGCDAKTTLWQQLQQCSGTRPSHLAILHAPRRCPLHVAATPPHADPFEKTVSVLQYLVQRGADVDSRDAGGRTPAHCASAAGSECRVLQALLDIGADPLARDMLNRTPAHVAVAAGNWDCYDVLLSAMPHDACDVHHELLHCAARENRPEAIRNTIQVLSKQGLALNPLKTNPTVFDGSTPLHVAAGYGHAATVAELLKVTGHGESGLDRDLTGRTPLHYAAAARDQAAAAQCIDLLIAHGHSVDAAQLSGARPLHEAAVAGRIDSCKKLVDSGCLTAITDGHSDAGETAVLAAVRSKRPVGDRGGAASRWPELYAPSWAAAKAGTATPRRKPILEPAGYYADGRMAPGGRAPRAVLPSQT